jgi:hypothetical protein
MPIWAFGTAITTLQPPNDVHLVTRPRSTLDGPFNVLDAHANIGRLLVYFSSKAVWSTTTRPFVYVFERQNSVVDLLGVVAPRHN